MAAAGVTVDMGGIKGLEKLLDDARLDAGAKAKLMGHVAGIVEEASRTRLDETKESPDGTAWKSWEESTRKYYERQGWGHRSLLRGNDNLLKSIRGEVATDANSAMVGATMEYAAVHQFGWADRNIAARPYLGVSEDDARDITDAAKDYLSRRFE